jgi:hypothetical protein
MMKPVRKPAQKAAVITSRSFLPDAST